MTIHGLNKFKPSVRPPLFVERSSSTYAKDDISLLLSEATIQPKSSTISSWTDHITLSRKVLYGKLSCCQTRRRRTASTFRNGETPINPKPAFRSPKI